MTTLPAVSTWGSQAPTRARRALLAALLVATAGVANSQSEASKPAPGEAFRTAPLVQIPSSPLGGTDGKAAVAQACLLDLQAIPVFLRDNDAGAQQAVSSDEEIKRRAAFESAQRQAGAAQDEAQCEATLQTYLGAWRKGHLSVHSMKPDGSAEVPRTAGVARSPAIEMLSPSTALITVPTFSPVARQPLAALLQQHRQALEAHPNWVIDLRSNGGGADSTYAPLLPWLMPDGWIEVSERVYVTPANVRAEGHLCEEFFAPGDAECARVSAQTVQRMRSVGDGQWVQQEYDEGWRYRRAENVQRHRPQRVAVLMSGTCGSSCEQFLLTVRQSFSVRLVGHRRSAGTLDASNLRPHLLPSGRRRLWYATTLSNRLPGLPVDGMGISPDVFLPWPEDPSDPTLDVKRTQRWLEGQGW